MKAPESHEDGQLNYHYDRYEREGSAARNLGKPRKSGILKGNRSLLVLLLDVILILVILAVFRFVIPLFAGQTALGGYSISLKGFIYDNQIYATLKIHKKIGEESRTPDTNIVEVTFKTADGENELQVSDLLPLHSEQDRFIREVLPYKGQATRLSVKVSIDEKTKTLHTDLKIE
jgi:hypothetical protein